MCPPSSIEEKPHEQHSSPFHVAIGRRRLGAGLPAGRRRAAQGREDRRAASGHRGAGLLRPAMPRGRADGDRGHQQGRRHQVAGRREDRGAAGRRAVDAAGRHRRSREDERGRRLGDPGRLRLGDLPGHHPGRGQVQPAARGRRRRGRPDRRARPEEHLPLRPRLQEVRRDRDDQPARAQHRGRQAGQDRDDHPRGVAVRHRHGQPAGARAARLRLRGQGSRSSTPTRRATSTTSCCG